MTEWTVYRQIDSRIPANCIGRLAFCFYRMIPIYLVTSLVLSATYATAVESGSRRGASLRANGVTQLHVAARPRVINFYRGQTIEIRCRSKGGYEVGDYPFLSFYVSIPPPSGVTFQTRVKTSVIAGREFVQYRDRHTGKGQSHSTDQ